MSLIHFDSAERIDNLPHLADNVQPAISLFIDGDRTLFGSTDSAASYIIAERNALQAQLNGLRQVVQRLEAEVAAANDAFDATCKHL